MAAGEWRCSDCERGEPTVRRPKTGGKRCQPCKARRSRELMKMAGTLSGYNARHHGTIAAKYSQCKTQAKKRNKVFTLTLAEFMALRSGRPCTYCGHDLPKVGVGLDQKVPGLGYTVENAVPCCTECNVAKSDRFTYDEMLVIGAAIRQVKDARRSAEAGPRNG